jgi:hypothetical protein
MAESVLYRLRVLPIVDEALADIFLVWAGAQSRVKTDTETQ